MTATSGKKRAEPSGEACVFGPAREAMTMRVLVDLNRCQGYGQCFFLAPGVFELRGEEALMYDPGPGEAQRAAVLRAAAACPVQAILVERRGRH